MNRNHTLDAMRGVAAIAVVLFHATNILQLRIAPHGYLAVDLFYVLSGFVIANAYDDRLSRGLTAARFGIMRALRFYPLYLLGLGLGLVHQLGLTLAHTDHSNTIPVLLLLLAAGAFFVPLPLKTEDLFPLNVPSWSLFYELLINVLYAATFRLWSVRNLTLLSALSGACLTWHVAS